MSLLLCPVLAFLVSPALIQVQSQSPDSPMDWMDSAETLVVEGKHAEALGLYLRCFDEGESDPSFVGVRVSFLLGHIERLGAVYPPAMDALRQRRDAALNAMVATTEAKSRRKAVTEVVGLNKALGDNADNLKLYDDLRDKGEDETLLRFVEVHIEDELERRGDAPRESIRMPFQPENQAVWKPYWQPGGSNESELDKRWSNVKLKVYKLSVELDSSFHRSLTSWQHSTEQPVTLVRGDAEDDIEGGANGVVHVLGDVSGTITGSKQCEIIIAGDLVEAGRIRLNGISKVFIGGSLKGEIQNRSSTTIFVQGDLSGSIQTGSPSTEIRVEGNFDGTIEPVRSGSMLSLNVEGSMLNDAIRGVTSHKWTRFQASIGRSDLPVGLYQGTVPGSAGWVVHSTGP